MHPNLCRGLEPVLVLLYVRLFAIFGVLAVCSAHCFFDMCVTTPYCDILTIYSGQGFNCVYSISIDNVRRFTAENLAHVKDIFKYAVSANNIALDRLVQRKLVITMSVVCKHQSFDAINSEFSMSYAPVENCRCCYQKSIWAVNNCFFPNARRELVPSSPTRGAQTSKVAFVNKYHFHVLDNRLVLASSIGAYSYALQPCEPA